MIVNPRRVSAFYVAYLTDSETNESFSEEYSSLKYTHLPDKFLWSDETKNKYQKAFHCNDIKQKFIDIDNQLKCGCIDAKSLIDSITDVMVLAGNKSSVRKSFKPTKRKMKKVNKNGMIRIVELY